MTTTFDAPTIAGLGLLGNLRAMRRAAHVHPMENAFRHFTERGGRVQGEFYATAPDARHLPEVRASYDALLVELIEQFEWLHVLGFEVEAWHRPGEPYATSDGLRADLDSFHIYYLPTDATGGLTTGHPMGEHIHTRYGTLLANDLFRIVHDAVAHSAGHSFGPRGERAAWWEHRRTMPAAARLALWNETTAQNAWTNYGPHMWRNGQFVDMPLRDRPYAEQRIVIPPTDWI